MMVRALTLALGSHEAAEDAAQEGFARCLHRWGTVSAMGRPGAWVYVVALRSQRRGFRRKHWSLGSPGELSASAEPLADRVVTRVWVEEALRGLPDRQRLALVLRYVVDLPLADVADAMGCSLGTVKATIHQALRRLRVQEQRTEVGTSGG